MQTFIHDITYFFPDHEKMRTVHCRLRPIVGLSVVTAIGLLLTLVGLMFHIWNQHTGMSFIMQRDVLDLVSPTGPLTVIRRKNVTIPLEVYNIKDKIAELAKKIYKAKKHVRGTKTSDSLTAAVNLVDTILEDLNINPLSLKGRPVVAAKTICPEEYKGTTYGYPFYYKGFEVKTCEYGKPITDLVTIAVYIKSLRSSDNTGKAVDKFIKSVYRQQPKFNLVIAADVPTQIAEKFTKKFPNLIFKDTFAIRGWSSGKVWNSLIDAVKTQYVFVARNVEFITNDTRFDRLIRELESLHLAAAGGAFRTPDGHWTNGCQQVAYRNYSLSFVHGYDESMHECLFCDYMQGPFISSKKTLKAFAFKNFEESNGLFEDLYLRLNKENLEVAVCPDSMFNTFKRVVEKEKWELFMIDWDLYQVRTPLGKTVVSACNRGVSFSKSKVSSPCGLNRLADAINFLMSTCEEANVICELQEGTALGAMKFNKILPWERDADVTFLSGNYSAFQALKDKFEKSEYRFTDLESLWCCADNRTAGGKFQIGTTGWNIEMYGQHRMDSELLITAEMKPTKVLLDGKWVNAPRNPGLFVRNRYGHEVYRHALHWLTMGLKSGWINYKTEHFLKCEEPGHHACLDQYNTDGNLQFQVPIP